MPSGWKGSNAPIGGSKCFALAVLVLATALATIYATQPVPNVITAHEFEVADDSGKVRVKMGIMADGGPSVMLFDEKGRVRAALLVLDHGGSAVVLRDAEGNRRMGLDVSREGESTIRRTLLPSG